MDIQEIFGRAVVVVGIGSNSNGMENTTRRTLEYELGKFWVSRHLNEVLMEVHGLKLEDLRP